MKKLYGVLDRVAQELTGRHMYLVMAFKTDPEAARYFSDAINDESSVLNKHPSDYALLYLGQILDTGEIRPETPSIVVTGDALIAAQDKIKLEA